jgi:restriction system protein
MNDDYRRLMMPWHERQAAAVPGLGQDAETASATPDAHIAAAMAEAQSRLAADLLGRIHAQNPAFFEELVLDVLLAMGYGAGRRDLSRKLGRSGDGGVDGLIAMDELGLDCIYLQAKRLKPGDAVPVSEVRDFAGSLEAHRAGKGVFLTTSHFSPAALDFCGRLARRLVLVDGRRLAELMIRHNIGVRVERSIEVKSIDPDYFPRRVPPPQGPQ